MPHLHANKMQGYCEKILEVLQDPAKCVSTFKQAD